MLDGIARQDAARALEREQSRTSAAAYNAWWNEYYKALDLDDLFETTGIMTIHKEHRRLEVTYRSRLVNGRLETFETINNATGEDITWGKP